MISDPMKYLGTLAFLLALGSCTTAPGTPMTLTSPYDSQDLRLVIKGQGAKNALNSSMNVEGLLDELGAPSAANIKGRINMLLNRPTDKLAGLGGIQSRAALEAALVTLNGPGNFDGPLTTVVVEGQIQDSVWGESGFYYKPGDPMHMWVQMITTATRITGGPTKVKRRAEMFRIEVASGALVEPRNDANMADVFPAFGSVAFAVSATMADDRRFKLWAVGTDVQVTNYWIDDNVDPVTGPVYMPSKKYTIANHPAKLSNIFSVDPDACIDMLFTLDPRVEFSAGGALENGELPSGAEPPYYCLGRCKNPPIVNTK